MSAFPMNDLSRADIAMEAKSCERWLEREARARDAGNLLEAAIYADRAEECSRAAFAVAEFYA